MVLSNSTFMPCVNDTCPDPTFGSPMEDAGKANRFAGCNLQYTACHASRPVGKSFTAMEIQLH